MDEILEKGEERSLPPTLGDALAFGIAFSKKFWQQPAMLAVIGYWAWGMRDCWRSPFGLSV
ncbi:hypothetical protein FACHB389_30250 [Nostoc calcicola FACHB-389]|nr:hypothetical protein [Nostoc calcicola FACHB-3891]OKH23894.1 hypothetical protein FACHB389_30250 [Nostoc calcicola FACHB-389]